MMITLLILTIMAKIKARNKKLLYPEAEKGLE